MPISISLDEGNGYVNRMRAVIKSFPEVVAVVSQHGRPDDGTDTAGFYNGEFYMPLKPPSDWPKGVTKEELTKDVIDKLQAEFPWVDFQRYPDGRGRWYFHAGADRTPFSVSAAIGL